MKRRLLISAFYVVLAVLAGTNFLWAQAVQGKVLDAETGEGMLGVAIQYNQTRNLGVVTDLEGNFSIPGHYLIQDVKLSFIGYGTVLIPKKDVPTNGKLWVITMLSETSELDEVEVLAGENPALRIVRNAINNRKVNNPEKYPSFKYVSYNKDVISYQLDKSDSIQSKRQEEAYVKDSISSQRRHMFVIESVTRKWFKAPNKEKEVVVGTKISGFKHPSVGAVPDGIQNFGFHQNIISLTSKKFLNPIADGADRKYVYILKDTLYDGNDTIFKMDYFPERGANFEGFKGELSIHTFKWALVQITAYPYDDGKINIYVEQEYQLIDGKYWFPLQMNFDLDLEQVPLRKSGAVLHGKTNLDSVEIGLEIPDERFNHIEVELLNTAGYVTEDFWETYRTEQLTRKEIQTYREMDSIGDKYNFDALLAATRKLYDGFIVMGKYDVEYSKILAYNEYEGIRFGLGLYTNEKISKKFRIGGYFGYGGTDKAWKYGGKAFWYFDKPNDFYLTAWYHNDVLDPGGIRIKYSEWKNVSQQFFNKRMDKNEEVGASITYRLANYSLIKAGFRRFSITPTYDYTFKGVEEPEGTVGTYQFAEFQLNYRWSYKEKYHTNYGQRIAGNPEFPIVNLVYSRGFNNVLNSQFDYNKIELGIFYSRYTKGLGRTRVALEFGYVDRPLPWSMNFSGRPSYNSSFSVVVRETFQTMRFNEFSSTQYWALFFMHDFKSLLFRYKIFKPEIRIFQGISYGKLDYRDMHESEANFVENVESLEQGFFESGLVFDNVIRINLFNTGYLGLGAGVFYRYGANSRPIEKENWTFKFAFMYSVN